MKARLIHEQQEQRTIAVTLEKGDEFISVLKEFAKKQHLKGSHFTAIGAFSDVTLEFFGQQEADYQRIPLNEQVEVLSLNGNIAVNDHEPQVHARVVLSKADGSTHGGHIREAHVWPALEVIVVEEPKHLQRKTDEETGLALIDYEASLRTL